MKQDIRTYLTAHRASPSNVEFGERDSLLEAGVIDSMTMVDLIVHLEQQYGISIGEDDMTPENFDTLEAIAAYVARKQNPAESFSN